MGEIQTWIQLIGSTGVIGLVALFIWRYPHVLKEQRMLRELELQNQTEQAKLQSASWDRERDADRVARHEALNSYNATVLQLMVQAKTEAASERQEFSRRTEALISAIDRQTELFRSALGDLKQTIVDGSCNYPILPLNHAPASHEGGTGPQPCSPRGKK